MHHYEQASVDGIERKRNLTPVVALSMVAVIILICTASLVATNHHDQSIREMRHAIELAGGIDSPQDIRFISFHGPQITDSNLRAIKWLKETQFLELYSTRVTDDGLAAVAEWTSLRYLSLNGTPLSDRSLDIIRNFGQLERLDLGGSQVTDAGLSKLAELKNLQKLDLNCCTMLTQAGVQRLQAALPICQIAWSPDPWVPIEEPAE